MQIQTAVAFSLSIGRITAGAAMNLGEGPTATAGSTLTVIFVGRALRIIVISAHKLHRYS